MKTKKVILLCLCAFVLCGMSTTPLSTQLRFRTTDDVYTLMKFPYPPTSLALNQYGDVAIGFKEFGVNKIALIKEGNLSRVYTFDASGEFAVEFIGKKLYIYPIRAESAFMCDLDSLSVNTVEITEEEIYCKYKTLSQITKISCGNNLLEGQTHESVYQLLLNNDVILQTTPTGTYAYFLIIVFIAAIGFSVAFYALKRIEKKSGFGDVQGH